MVNWLFFPESTSDDPVDFSKLLIRQLNDPPGLGQTLSSGFLGGRGEIEVLVQPAAGLFNAAVTA